MRALLLLLALVVLPAAAQDEKKAPPKKKPAASQKMPVAKGHTKPTPEQIRKFNELEKKQGK